MKVPLAIIKLLVSFSLVFIFLLIGSCDLVKTYTEDQYLALGDNGSDKNKESTPGVSEIEVIVEAYNYTLNNKELFNFNNLPFSERTSEIIFRIYNNGTESLELTGIPIITTTNNTDFTISQNSTSSTISPNDSTTFSVEFSSNATSGDFKLATITIPNNSNNNPFLFTIGCTAKASGVVELTNAGTTTNWLCPAFDASLDITLVGGGGGGGGGGDGMTIFGGGGGGAGQKIQFSIPKDENYQYSIYIGKRGNRGWQDISGFNGESSYINYNDTQIIANFGSGGIAGSNGGNGGTGYPRGQNSYDAGDKSNGAPGGDNGRGHGDMADNGDHGNEAPPNSGGGGSGGGSGSTRGGHGGSGYCRIEWTGFVIP